MLSYDGFMSCLFSEAGAKMGPNTSVPVSCIDQFCERPRKCIENALEIHELFNLAQMLQGENLPASIVQLRRCIEAKSRRLSRHQKQPDRLQCLHG